MNTIKQITIAIVALIFLNSCDADELTEVKINTEITKDITFTTNDDGDFSESFTVDFANNDDLNDYLSKIKSVKINSASYLIKAFNGTTASGDITFMSENQSFGPYTHTSISSDFSNQTIFPINDVDKLSVLATNLKDTNQLQVEVSGTTTSTAPFTMTLSVTFDLTIVAQIL